MPQSNINSMYENIIANLAERVRVIMDEDGGADNETDAMWQAIDEGLIYTSDQAYVVAHAFCNGLMEWGKAPYWEDIISDLYADIMDELEKLRGEN